jgi:hypothetical protein
MQTVSLQLKERQLARREQTLERMYKEMREIVQVSEQLTQQIARNLHQQEQDLTSRETYPQEVNQFTAHLPTPLAIPLDPAPSH